MQYDIVPYFLFIEIFIVIMLIVSTFTEIRNTAINIENRKVVRCTKSCTWCNHVGIRFSLVMVSASFCPRKLTFKSMSAMSSFVFRCA